MTALTALTAPIGPLVVIGLGNVLLRDDGVGVRVVEALRREAGTNPDRLPEDTRLVDGGTLGLGLLGELDGARGLLLVDAVDLDLAPGTVIVRDAAELAAAGPSSLRGLAELVGSARMLGLLPDAVALIGIQLGEISVDLALSPAVASALPAAVDIAAAELWRLDAVARHETGSVARTAPVGVGR